MSNLNFNGISYYEIRLLIQNAFGKAFDGITETNQYLMMAMQKENRKVVPLPKPRNQLRNLGRQSVCVGSKLHY